MKSSAFSIIVVLFKNWNFWFHDLAECVKLIKIQQKIEFSHALVFEREALSAEKHFHFLFKKFIYYWRTNFSNFKNEEFKVIHNQSLQHSKLLFNAMQNQTYRWKLLNELCFHFFVIFHFLFEIKNRFPILFCLGLT